MVDDRRLAGEIEQSVRAGEEARHPDTPLGPTRAKGVKFRPVRKVLRTLAVLVMGLVVVGLVVGLAAAAYVSENWAAALQVGLAAIALLVPMLVAQLGRNRSRRD